MKNQGEPSTKKRKLSTEEDSYSAIEKLNDDCLEYIFQFLSVADRIRIERVCRKWKKVAKNSWTKFKVLNLDAKYLGLKPSNIRHEIPTITDHITEEILKRCGRYLKKIDSNFLKLTDFMCLVAKYCKNIQTITYVRVTVQGLKTLIRNCNNISDLYLSYYLEKPKEDTLLGELFSKNRKLRALKFCISDGFGECLLKLPLAEMEKLAISFFLRNAACRKHVINHVRF